MTKITVKQLKVGIIGAGWLGEPLANALQKEGAKVVVTRQNPAEVERLSQQGLNAVQLSLPCASIADIPDKLLKKDCLIVCLPPGLRSGKTDYQQKLEQLVEAVQLKKSKVKQLILISSTAVYNGLFGKVNELSELNLQGNKVSPLLAAERVILNNPGTNNIVLRLGGLMGYNRHPGRFFKEGSKIANPDSVVNFIHRDDVIGLLTGILQHHQGNANPSSYIYNGVSPNHPSRRQFYQTAMGALNNPEPQFAEQQESCVDGICGKQVDSVLVDKLGYNFKHQDLLLWLTNGKQ